MNPLLSLTLIAALLAGGCSSLSKKERKLLSDAFDTAKKNNPQLAALSTKYERYLKMADTLKKFHDSGELDQKDLLDVLHASGVTSGAPPAAAGAKAAPKGGAHKVAQVPPPVQDYHGKFRWPLDAGIVSSEYGHRWGKNHDGVDIAADKGEPVKAVADGTVIYADSTMRGYGNALVVRHDTTVTTLYAHNEALLAKAGESVKQGQVIALLGSTGHSTGPHVHFEFRQGKLALNPRDHLVKARF